jgi:O-methyltransferase involved in polyketide biosynthesis
MSDKIHTNIGDIQKTLLLPLWGRAVETQKSVPLVNLDGSSGVIILIQ